MSVNIHTIIISKSGDATFLQQVQNYNLSTDTASVIYPNDSNYETTLIKSQLRIESGWYNLIIYDWAYSILPTNNDIQTVITSITNLDQNINPWSVAYLGKWMDTCNKYNNFSDAGKFDLVSGTEPIGFHAVLLTQSMSEKLLNKLNAQVYYSINYTLQDIGIEDSSVKYIAVSPNLFTYDPMYNKVDTSKIYATKTNECSGTTSEVVPPSDNDLTLFWVLLLVIGVSLTIWFILSTQNIDTNTYSQIDSDRTL